MEKEVDYKERNVTCNNCGSLRCFESYTEPRTHESYLCVQCGYMSLSLYQPGSDILKNMLDKSADIIEELQLLDEDRNMVWLPAGLNMGENGIIYPDGKLTDWYWNYAKIVDVPEEERDQYDGHDKKLDIENPQIFGQFEFLDACKAMGIMMEDAGDKVNL